MKVNAVSGVISVVVSFVVGGLLLWLKGVVRRRIATAREAREAEHHADHTTIGSGWFFDDLVGASAEFLVCVRAAPSKRLPAPVRLVVDRIAPFVRAALGDLFPPEPEVSIPTATVRYRRKDTGHPGVDQFVVVSPSGLIEATVPITHSSSDSGEPIIPLVEIARALLPATRAIQQGYEQILGPGAVIPLGLDWEFKLSRELVGQPSIPWTALAFPGRVPDGRATDQRPPWPRPGFGHDQLRCVATTTAPEDILLAALADLVERSGYYGTEQALSDLRVAIRQLDRQTTSPDTATPADT